MRYTKHAHEGGAIISDTDTYDVGCNASVSVTWNKDTLRLDIYLPPKTNCLVDYHSSVDSPLNVDDDKKKLSRNELAELVEHFSSCSNIPVPRATTQRQRGTVAVRWWRPTKELAALYDNDVAKTRALISTVIKRMRGDGLTISAPQSILAVAIDERAKSGKGNVSVW